MGGELRHTVYDQLDQEEFEQRRDCKGAELTLRAPMADPLIATLAA